MKTFARLAALALAICAAQPVTAQTTPAISGDAVAGAPAVLPATSTASSRTVKQQVTVQLCSSGGNYVVCPATVAGQQTSANSASVTPANDATFAVAGDRAGGATDGGNPIKIGGWAGSSPQTAVSTGQRVSAWYNLNGVAVTAQTGSTAMVDNDSNTTGYSLSYNSGAVGYPMAVRGQVYNPGTTLWDRQRGDSTGTYVVAKGGGSLATGQISVGTSSTLLAAARTGRQKIAVSVGAANTCAFGNTGVTTSTGFRLQPTAGASLSLDFAGALYAACSSTTTVDYIEQF